MGNAFPMPQADVQAPPLQGGMRNASPALQAALPAPPLQGGWGMPPRRSRLQAAAPAPPLQGGVRVNDINLEKLGDNGSVMTDTCHGAQKTCSIYQRKSTLNVLLQPSTKCMGQKSLDLVE